MSDIGMTVGLIKALGGNIDPAQIEQSVTDWLDDHPEATTTVEDGSITKAKLDVELKAEIEKKADNDGLYEQMTVGNAEQLVATVGVEDKVPYNFRTAGGSADIGDRETDMIVGGTIAWNQLMQNGNFANTTGITAYSGSISANNNELAFTVTDTSGAVTPQIRFASMDYQVGHKYFVTYKHKPAHDQTSKTHIFLLKKTGGVNYTFGADTLVANKWNNIEKIIYINPTIANGSTYGTLQYAFQMLGTNGYEVNDVDYIKDIMIIDLTQMFGTTIADYIYNLEQATPGAGVAWFRKLFPKNYYAYNAGELMSVQAASHKTVGFNAWDEEWDEGAINVDTGENYNQTGRVRVKNYIPILPNTTYYKKSPAPGMYWHIYYDADKNWVGKAGVAYNSTFTTPSNAYYMRSYTENGYGSTYKNDICINLSWDGERDGEYEAYDEHVYPLDDSLTLRGIPKLDANNNLYYDGDTYEADGTVTRKYGIVDLGTLTWVLYETNGKRTFNTNSITMPAKSVAVMSKEYTYKTALLISTQEEKTFETFGAPQFSICDTSFTGDAAAFKTAMSGVMLVYKLATPTTETADPFQNPQIVDDFGTEEYIDAGVTASTPTRDVAIPVGHETTYQANLRAKLEMAPESPDGDGDYIVRQTNGQNEYVELVIPTELPTAPTSDGNYVLKCTVSNGTATYAWEVQS